MAGWLGVTVEQAPKGAPVGKEMTGTAVETSNTIATRGLMFQCVLHLHNNKSIIERFIENDIGRLAVCS